jgi:hypothetical protein
LCRQHDLNRTRDDLGCAAGGGGVGVGAQSERHGRKALADAKVYFNAKAAKKPATYYKNGAKTANKNLNKFIAAARRR